MRLLRITILLALLIVSNQLAFSQEKKTIQLINKVTEEPIVGANFSYENQKGFSDEFGKIQIEFKANNDLNLSHVNYGQWKLSNEEVIKALNEGSFLRKSNVVNLQPVSVIAYHNSSQTKRIDLNYQDKLNHDAGTVLNSDVSINSIKKSGAYGFDPVFRGFKYDQLNVVINGSCSASAACPNRMDPITSQIPLNAIETIQILKGPYSLRYGNSFGATINFMTGKPVFSEKLKTTERFSTTYENNGNVYRSEGYFGLHSKKIDFNLVGSWSEGDDYTAGNDNIIQSDFLRASFGANLSAKITNNQLISVSVNRNIGRNTDFPSLPMDLISDDTWMLSAEHNLLLKNRKLSTWKTLVYATHVDHLMDNSLKILNPRTMNAKSPTQTLTFGGRTEATLITKNTTTYAGFDLRVENAEGSRTREMLTGMKPVFVDNIWQNSSIERSGFFVETNINTPNFNYVVAGRLEINKSQAKDAATEFTNINPNTSVTQLNPNLSFGIIKNFNQHYSLKFWLGSSQRSGSLTEKYINYFSVGRDAYELLGNPELKPERNNQTDLIFEIKTEKTFLNVDVFASYMQNYITSIKNPDLIKRIASSPGVRQFQNAGNAFKTGFEMNWKQYLFYGIQHQAGLAYTYAKDLENDEALPEIAPFEIRYSLMGKFFNDKLSSDISLRHALKQDRISLEYGEKETPAFTNVDFNISYKLFNFMNLATGVQNLFNETYYEHLNRAISGSATDYIFNRGRNVYFRMVIEIR